MKQTQLTLMLDFPFFGQVASSIGLVPTREVKTASINGKYLKYNPDVIKNLSSKERLYIYKHEICHVVLGHPFRRGDRDHVMYNMAGDYAINLMLTDLLKIPPPVDGLYDEKYRGWSEEQIYEDIYQEFHEASEKLKQEQEQSGQGDSGDGDSDSDQDDSDQDGSDQGQESDKDDSEDNSDQGTGTGDNDEDGDGDGDGDEDGDEDSDGDEDGDSKDDQTGSGQDNKPNPKPKPDPKTERFKEMLESVEKHGLFEDAPEDLKQHEVESNINMADKLTNDAGIDPGSILREVLDEITSTEIPWQEYLARFMNKSCDASYNWMIPNKRYSMGDVIMPSLHVNQSLKLAVAIDTSGSIDYDLLNRFMAEFKTLISSIEYTELMMISCDTDVYNPEVFFKFQEIDYKPIGGGGTYFYPVFDFLHETGFIPDCLVYFTDLGVWEPPAGFGRDPGYPVLWIGEFGGRQMETPFGEAVDMKKKYFEKA